jgi:hypothetical protein
MGSVSEVLSSPSHSRLQSPTQSRTNSPRAAETDTNPHAAIEKAAQQLLEESPLPRQESNIDNAATALSESEALESLKLESEKIIVRPLRPQRPNISASDPYTRQLVQQLLTGDKSAKIYDETLRRLAETTEIIQKEIDLRMSLKHSNSVIREASNEEEYRDLDNRGDNVDSDLSDDDK